MHRHARQGRHRRGQADGQGLAFAGGHFRDAGCRAVRRLPSAGSGGCLAQCFGRACGAAPSASRERASLQPVLAQRARNNASAAGRCSLCHVSARLVRGRFAQRRNPPAIAPVVLPSASVCAPVPARHPGASGRGPTVVRAAAAAAPCQSASCAMAGLGDRWQRLTCCGLNRRSTCWRNACASCSASGGAAAPKRTQARSPIRGRSVRLAGTRRHRATARRARTTGSSGWRLSVSAGSVTMSPPWRVLRAALGSCMTAPALSRSSRHRGAHLGRGDSGGP